MYHSFGAQFWRAVFDTLFRPGGGFYSLTLFSLLGFGFCLRGDDEGIAEKVLLRLLCMSLRDHVYLIFNITYWRNEDNDQPSFGADITDVDLSPLTSDLLETYEDRITLQMPNGIIKC